LIVIEPVLVVPDGGRVGQPRVAAPHAPKRRKRQHSIRTVAGVVIQKRIHHSLNEGGRLMSLEGTPPGRGGDR
jgi:hypothetical protein